MTTYIFPNHTKGDTLLSPVFEVIINGSAIDIAGYNIKMQVRKGAAITSPVVLEYSTSDGTIEAVGESTAGKFKLSENIVDIPVGTYKYDIEFEEITTEKVRTWIKGTWTITEEVTQ